MVMATHALSQGQCRWGRSGQHYFSEAAHVSQRGAGTHACERGCHNPGLNEYWQRVCMCSRAWLHACSSMCMTGRPAPCNLRVGESRQEQRLTWSALALGPSHLLRRTFRVHVHFHHRTRSTAAPSTTATTTSTTTTTTTTRCMRRHGSTPGWRAPNRHAYANDTMQSTRSARSLQRTVSPPPAALKPLSNLRLLPFLAVECRPCHVT
jgi:hypothetical protein